MILSIVLLFCSSSFAMDSVSNEILKNAEKYTQLTQLLKPAQAEQIDLDKTCQDKIALEQTRLELLDDLDIDFEDFSLDLSVADNSEKKDEEQVSRFAKIKEKLEMLSMILEELTFKEKIAFLYDLVKEPVVDNSIAAKDHVVSNQKKYIVGSVAVLTVAAFFYFKPFSQTLNISSEGK